MQKVFQDLRGLMYSDVATHQLTTLGGGSKAEALGSDPSSYLAVGS